MAHPLVEQLRFTRGEFQRCLEGLSAEDAERRLGQSNSLGWTVGHMANHERFLWLMVAQGVDDVAPGLHERVGTGAPASTPELEEMWGIWREVSEKADPYLDGLDAEGLEARWSFRGKDFTESIGTQMQRVIYHYWFHIGESHGLRQQMGHEELPEFVGALGKLAPHRRS